MNRGLKTFAHRSGKFVSVTTLGTFVESLILWFLVEYVFQSYESRYLVAPTISFECAVVNNFLFSYFWIWGDRVEGTPGDMLARFGVYNIATFLVFLVKLGLLAGIGRLTGWHPVVCNLLALMLTGLFNFVVQDEAVFKPQLIQPEPDQNTVNDGIVRRIRSRVKHSIWLRQ